MTSLSFPFGQWNKRIWEKAKSIGYTSATAYAKRIKSEPGVLPLWGVYSFDSVEDVLDRVEGPAPFSHATARGFLMPHFAKGTPIWKFRKNYAVWR